MFVRQKKDSGQPAADKLWQSTKEVKLEGAYGKLNVELSNLDLLWR